jgi:hypothetical protein
MDDFSSDFADTCLNEFFKKLNVKLEDLERKLINYS